jgi:integrase
MGTLTARGVLAHKTPGTYSDGGGLYLQVAKGGAKSWLLRFQRDGRRREMGFGGVDRVGLAEARDKAIEARRLLAAGIDPIEARRVERAKSEIVAAKVLSFKDAAERYIQAHKAGWRNPKHRRQWSSTLETYVYPQFGVVAIDAVDVDMVLNAIEPIWTVTPETASRVRGRIERIIDWAKARGYRRGENPARWRGHLENLLPKRSKVRRVEHHAALPYGEIADFIDQLRSQKGTAARALEFAILTAARTSEVLGATWAEFDIADKLWTLPPDRMKAGKEHRVPLSDSAMSVITEMAAIRCSEYVFPGAQVGRPLSNMALLMTLRRMGRSDLTAHGFRSTICDWAAEQTNFPREVAEMALAHAVGDKVEAAYRRGDLFQKRRRLMDAWAAYCASSPKGASIVPIRRRATQSE